VLAALIAAMLLVAAGCGGSDERTSNLRPPSRINVAVTIQDDEVTASPGKIGAGPIDLLVSNQSSASQRLTIDGPQLEQSVGPINPRDTANLRVTVRPGEYTVSTDASSSGPKPDTLTVGPKRPSSQNELELP
jgi:hypothetical protein